MTVTAFDLRGPLPPGRTLIEASAGTGKTYSLAALVARFVAGDLAHNHDLAEGVNIEDVLVVTYTRAAAAELRDRIRLKLRIAADYLDGGRLPADDEWVRVFDAGTHRVRQQRSARVRRAMVNFDDATITTIHGFCQQALAQSGLRTGVSGTLQLLENDSELIAEVVRDLLLDRLSASPLALSPDRHGRPLDHRSFGAGAINARRPLHPGDVERHVLAAVRAVLSNPGARREPDPSIDGLGGAWAECVVDAIAEVERRQRARRQIGYDRLVSDLATALADPVDGQPLADQLAARYRLVLVDEFQDTDRLQWQIFDRAFAGHRLITVGDPKQAIFRFRGADVHAYLDAVRSAERVTLRTNHRSDRQLLDALALLFDGAQLGHADIEFARVDPSPTAPHNALGETVVQLRVVPDDDAVAHTTTSSMEAGAAAGLVLADVAARVRTLLDSAAIGSGRTAESLQPEDIGILVPSQRRAAETANVLREWGVPTVRARTGSVLQTEAAMQWRLLLAGLATPTYAPVARAAGLSWFFDIPPGELVATRDGPEVPGESALAGLQRRLATLAERMRRDGVGALHEEVRATPQLLRAVLGRPNGERDLTDLDHLAELLVAEVAGQPAEPAAAAEAFDRMVVQADDQAEAAMRRVETDGDAVHITTVHSAKGLEYPVVLVPFAYTERATASRPYVFNDDHGRVIDVASWVAWGDGLDEGSKGAVDAMAERKRLATIEVDGDSLRLLYVALTRAKHHLEVWWAPTRRAGTSALGRLLLDRWGAGPVFNSPLGDAYEKTDSAAASTQIDAIVAASNGTVARFDVPLEEQPIRTPLPLRVPPATLLAVADAGARHPLADPARRTWSFTALTAGLAVGPDHAAAVPVAGGYDEVPASADEDVDAAEADHGDGDGDGDPTAAAAMPLAAAPGGTTFGIAVHQVLEKVDFQSPSLSDDVAEHVATASHRAGLQLDVSTTTAGLMAVIQTPLGRLFDGRPLSDFAARDRLRELAFDLTFGATRVAASQIGAVLSATLDADDPLGDYGPKLTSALAVTELAGWLTGSIDAVFRVGGGQQRFVVVDYKSNRLHARDATDPLAAYRPDLLAAAMTHSHYPLQAVLYCVALHRYLTWRLGADYAPERHLGGVAYLFVRGMVGESPPTSDGEPYGVFSWDPPPATVLALDALFRGGIVMLTVTTPPRVVGLQPWIDAGALGAAEVHAAAIIADLVGPTDGTDEVVLAVALAVWAPQHGHACIDLGTIAGVVAAEQSIAAADAAAPSASPPPLPWPSTDAWLVALRASSAVREVAEADDAAVLDGRPLVLSGLRVYTQRQWVDECAVATAVRRRAAPTMAATTSTAVLDRMLPPQHDGAESRQHASAVAVSSGLITVVAGGPGTGKTHTVASLLAAELAGSPELRVRLAAPTGKAASRLSDAVAAIAERGRRDGDLDAGVAERLAGLQATTVHRLLGWRPDSRTRFRHDADNPVPADLVVVDETSMLALPLTARLLAAVPEDCRLVLVGDPDQLRSIEVGTVLADVVAAGEPGGRLAGRVVRLDQQHRTGKGSPIGPLAEAIRQGDADGTIDLLRGGSDARLEFVDVPGDSIAGDPVDAVLDAVGPAYVAARQAAVSGDSAAAYDTIATARILCGHRRGAFGVATWNELAEDWLVKRGPPGNGGRPLLATRNDPRTGLSNGDPGVLVSAGTATRAVFRRGAELVSFDLAELDAVEVAYALTVHKSQGSEYETVAVIHPPVDSALISRELLYTAVTRASSRLVVVGSVDSIRKAVLTPTRRVSGLAAALAADRTP